MASTFQTPYKALHQFNHLTIKLSQGQSPPCKWLVLLVYRSRACSLALLTTRPQRVMAGGQQQSKAKTFNIQMNNNTGRALFLKNGDRYAISINA